MEETRLSVVVGTYNRVVLLKTCIESIFAQTKTPTKVYVIDAGSADGTQEYLIGAASERLLPRLTGVRAGQAHQLNEVFRVIDTPFVAWLSDDNEIVNNGLDRGVGILDRHPAIAMVGLKVRDVTGPFTQAPYIGGVTSIGVLNVNQGLLRTEVLRTVSYFSETFDFYGIDPDLTTKVLYSGHDIVYTKAIAVHHHRSWLTDEESPEYADQHRRRKESLELYRRKYAGFGETDRSWHRKKRAWQKVYRRLARLRDPHSAAPLLGGLYRDWKNAFTCRHVSLFDPWLSIGSDFHLRQHVPRHQVPPDLPPDPT